MDLITAYPPDPGPVGAPGHYTAHDWLGESVRTLEAAGQPTDSAWATYEGTPCEGYPSLYMPVAVSRIGPWVTISGLGRVKTGQSLAAGQTVCHIPPRFWVCPDPSALPDVRLICSGNSGEDVASRFDVTAGSGAIIWYGPALVAGAYFALQADWLSL